MNSQKKRRVMWQLCAWFVLVTGIAWVMPHTAVADFPERPITIIVGNDPGGSADVITRALAAAAEKYIGKPFVVENRGGGGGAVALGTLLTSKPDGYTLGAVPNDAIINTALLQKVPYKPLKSFVSVIGHSSSEHSALLVKSDARWSNLKEFVDYAKKNPGKVKYSSAGVGTGLHTAMEFVAHKEGIKWVHVPFKGTTPARTALLGGHVDACTSGVDWLPFVQSGQLRVLATHGHERAPWSPGVPTLKELGYDFVSETVHAIIAPAGLPPDVLKKLETALSKGTETQEFKVVQEKLCLTPVNFNSAQFDRHLKEHWTKTERIFKETGIIKEAATQPY